MSLQSLGTINTSQKMVGVTLAGQDANGNPVPYFNTAINVDSGVVSIQNIAIVPSSNPPVVSFDVVAASVGLATITVQANAVSNDNSTQFSQQVTVTVVQNPNVPGPATHFIITPGSIVSQ